MTAYRTPIARVQVHSVGYTRLSNGALITKVPLIETPQPGPEYLARLGAGPAMRWLASKGMRLPTTSELRELDRLALPLTPTTLPTLTMLRNAKVPQPWAYPKGHPKAGQDTPAMARYRAANIMSEWWCRIHDETAWLKAANAAWDGVQPLSDLGKHWGTGKRGPTTPCIFGWRGLQPESYFHLSEPTYVDYATTTHGVID